MSVNWTDAKVHLGCGARRLAGWVNVDVHETAATDVVADVCTFAAELPDASLAWVYSSHMIEHLYTDLVPGFLANIRRALKPGGLFTVATTDLDGIYNNRYKTNNDGPLWEVALFGRSTSRSDPMMAHRDCFTHAKLSRLMLAAGFSKARKWEPKQYAAIAQLQDHSTRSRNVSCLVEGVR